MASTTVSSLATLKLEIARDFSQSIEFSKVGTASGGLTAACMHSTFYASGYPGAGSAYGGGSGNLLNNDTAGAIRLITVGDASSDIYCCGFTGTSTAGFCNVRLEDILWGVSGLSLLTAATTTITGSTITRHTSVGGQLYLECHTATTGTLTVNPVITVSYTNQSGTSGRTARFYDVGGQERVTSSCNTVGRRVMATLQQGDTGVLSVQSLTVGTASTGWTAGSWALVIAKPLLTFRATLNDQKRFTVGDFMHTGNIKIHSGTSTITETPCLNLVFIGGSSVTPTIQGKLLCYNKT